MEAVQNPVTPNNTNQSDEQGGRRGCCGRSGSGRHRRGAGFVIVLALAAGLIGGYVGKSFAHGPFGGGFGGPMAMGAMADPAKVDSQIERMVKHFAVEVDATPAQRDKIAGIAKAAARDLLPLRTKLQDARKQATALAGAPTVDRAAMEKLRSEQIALADTASKRVTQALADAGEVLTPEQRQKIAAHMKSRQEGRGWFNRG